jgi:translation initiation factor IF-1
MLAQPIDEPHDPLVAIARLTVGQRAQAVTEQVAGHTHRRRRIERRDTADEMRRPAFFLVRTRKCSPREGLPARPRGQSQRSASGGTMSPDDAAFLDGRPTYPGRSPEVPTSSAGRPLSPASSLSHLRFGWGRRQHRPLSSGRRVPADAWVWRPAHESGPHGHSIRVLANDDVAVAVVDDVLDIGRLVTRQQEEQLRILADRLVAAQVQPDDVVAVRSAALADEAGEVVLRATAVDAGLEALVQRPEGALVACDAIDSAAGHDALLPQGDATKSGGRNET